MLWNIKYRPQSAKEIVGSQDQLKQISEFLDQFNYKKSKALLLVGPSGIGKTCIPYALAKERNLEVIEANSSEVRNKDHMETRIGAAMKQRSLFSRGKIILIDEIDALSGMKDRGGLPTLLNLAEQSSFPVIFTASNVDDYKFNKLKKACEVLHLQGPSHQELFSHLQSIASKENKQANEDALKLLARKSGSDIRGAINDLQSLHEITQETIDYLDDREQTEEIKNALLKIFKTTDLSVALSSFDYVNEDMKAWMLWFDENIPIEYEKSEDIEKAYYNLAMADIYQRRIMRWQHWRFLVYINAYLAGGIALSKQEKYKKMTHLKPSGRLLKIFWANQKSAKKKAIAQKLPSHGSLKRKQEDVEFLKIMAKNSKNSLNAIETELDLEKEEVAWLTK